MSRKPAPSARNRPAGRENLSDPVSTIGRLSPSLLGLSLTAGPANAGKVALLLERYLARLDDEPFLIVPNRSDVERVERDLLARSGCLLGGTIGTFDDLFERIAGGDAAPRPVLSQAQRVLAVRRAVDEVLRADGSLRLLGSSAR